MGIWKDKTELIHLIRSNVNRGEIIGSKTVVKSRYANFTVWWTDQNKNLRHDYWGGNKVWSEAACWKQYQYHPFLCTILALKVNQGSKDFIAVKNIFLFLFWMQKLLTSPLWMCYIRIILWMLNQTNFTGKINFHFLKSCQSLVWSKVEVHVTPSLSLLSVCFPPTTFQTVSPHALPSCPSGPTQPPLSKWLSRFRITYLLHVSLHSQIRWDLKKGFGFPIGRTSDKPKTAKTMTILLRNSNFFPFSVKLTIIFISLAPHHLHKQRSSVSKSIAGL